MAIVIVGAGHAAGQAAASLRQEKYTGEIIIIGDDQRGRIAFAWEVGYMKALTAAVRAG